MTRLVSRLALIGTCAIGLGGLVAVPAEAAVNSPAVTPATQITPESAVLNGVVDTGFVLPATTYTFEYDTLADWTAGGDNAQFAPDIPGELDASTSLDPVAVMIGCHPMSVCNNLGELPLTPGTKYVYFLNSQPGVSGSYLGTQSLVSNEGMFSTPKLGKVNVASMALLAGGSARIAVTDASALAAKGSIKVSWRGRKIGTGKFKLASNATGTVKVALPGALALLFESTTTGTGKHMRTIPGVSSVTLKVTGTTRTDQPVSGGAVTLTK